MSPPRRRHPSTSWLGDFPRRARVEAAARAAFPDLHIRRRRAPHTWLHVYTARVDVPGYEPRTVRVEVDRRDPDHPEVFADGPNDSPHRWPDRDRHRLCIWYPTDPPERRWVPDDGLLALFGLAAQHLFLEAWWREHGEWLGPEAPHTSALAEATSKTHGK